MKTPCGPVVGVSHSSHHPLGRVGKELVSADLKAHVCFGKRWGFSLNMYKAGLNTTGTGMKECGAFWEYTLCPLSPTISLAHLQKPLLSWGLCYLLRSSFFLSRCSSTFLSSLIVCLLLYHPLTPVPCSHFQEHSFVWLSHHPDKEMLACLLACFSFFFSSLLSFLSSLNCNAISLFYLATH